MMRESCFRGLVSWVPVLVRGSDPGGRPAWRLLKAATHSSGRAIFFGRQFQLRHHTTASARQSGHDNRADPIGKRSRVRIRTGRQPPGVAANHTSPRCVGPIRPILGWTPISDSSKSQLIIGERGGLPCLDVGLGPKPYQMPVQRLA